ncbi:MAG: hypothetical protein GY811_29250 [Myxococcales bacterium]|nr:hypothetical protein [Myxococcales bacterium]
MGKNRFVYALVASVGLLALSCGGKTTQVKSDLTITSTPEGQLEGPLKVVIRFSKPMVEPSGVGELAESQLVKFAPVIAGESRWQDEQTLVFVPSQSIPVSTNFVGKVPKGIKALDGNILDGAHSFEFATERLTGELKIVGSNSRATKDQLVKIQFNQEVPFESVAKHCVYDNGKKTQALKLGPDSDPGPGKTFLVVPTDDLAMDTDWKLSCAATLQGTIGNLGMTDKVSESFHTYGPLKFIGHKPSGIDIVPTEDLNLDLAFTNPLKAPYKMVISPKVRGFPERCHALGDAPPGVSCGVLLDPRTSYTIKVKKGQLDVFDQPLGKEEVIKFSTTDSKPIISMESGYFVAELKRPVLPIWTRNVKKLKVSMVAITPESFHQSKELIDWWDEDPADFGDSKLKRWHKKLKVSGERNKWHQFALDPATHLGGESGPGMYYVEIGSSEVDKYPFEDGGVKKTLVNFTDIGVVSKLSPSRGLVWATKLSTGESLPGAEVTVRDLRGKVTWSGRTDAKGIAMLPGTNKLAGLKAGSEEHPGDLRVFVRQGNDFTMVDPNSNGGLSAWNFNAEMDYERSEERLRGFMHTDRGLYRPGEKVHMKGLARITKLGSRLAIPKNKEIKLEIAGPRGKIFHTVDLKLSKFGGFWTDIELPGDARLGDYRMTAKLAQGTFTQRFSVEEFRAATFEVTGKASQERIVRRGKVTASILAKYFYGAPLRQGDVDITVHSRPRTVRFKEHEGFDFRDERNHRSYYSYSSSYSQSLITEDNMSLDNEGNAKLAVSVSPSDVSSDADLLVRASVTAPSNEVINKTFTIPYFRSRRYYGIKTPSYFLDVKKPQTFEVIGVSPDGRVVDGDVKVKVTKRDWNCVWEDWGYRGSYQCKETKQTIMDKTVTIAGGQPASFTFTPEGGGDYWVVVEGKDHHSSAAQELYAWGDGGGSWRSDDSMTFDIIADKKEYKAGDTATLILKTDLAKAKGLVTIERDGIIEKRFVDITSDMKHIKVPITAAHAPNVYVSVALVQGRMGEGRRGKPRMRMGLVNLPVRPEDNTLKVAVSTDTKDYRPGAPIRATVKVTDSTGKPVSAEVALTAADEGVLSLIGYKTPNPVPTFYSPWGIAVRTATQLAYIKDIPGPNTERPATGGDSGGPGSVRSRFMSSAIWKPGIVTNAQGIANVEFKAPDNLTAFRVMAVAADKGYRFGSSDKRFTVSKPLQLHRLLPRFLTKGDTLEGGVVVHNETGKAGTATIMIKHDALLATDGETTRKIKMPAGARIPVLFSLKGVGLGISELTFSVKMGNDQDAVRFKLPVHHPSPLRKTHVAHGATSGEKSISINLPANAVASSAEVFISVDPDGLAGIEDGLRDLIGYPYGCLEQTTSKVIPMIAVRGLADSLKLKELEGGKLDGFVKAGIAKIGRHQTNSGGFSLWPGGHASAYYTAYALWGLHLAKQAGYRVDQVRIDDGLEYLRWRGKNPDTSEDYYDPGGNLSDQAFALYVRAMLGSKDTQGVTKLMEDAEKMPVYGKAFLLRALVADVGPKAPAAVALTKELSELAKAAVDRETLIGETNGARLYYYMSSSLRTTAIVLDALVAVDPENEIIKPTVRNLMKGRRKMRYPTTQGNLYSLLALNNYAGSLKGKAPKVVVSLGDQELIAGSLKGTDRMRVASAFVPGTSPAIVIKPQGEVYYNVELRYRQKEESLKDESNGLALKREYLDEKGQPKSTFKIGDVVLVRLTMPLNSSASHLMVSDRLPAGFEALNTKFTTVGSAGSPNAPSSRRYWGGFQEMHDDRVDFSSQYNWRGTYTREYMMRAIAEGHFAVPPSHAELMYEPEKNAQTALGYLDVKAK